MPWTSSPGPTTTTILSPGGSSPGRHRSAASSRRCRAWPPGFRDCRRSQQPSPPHRLPLLHRQDREDICPHPRYCTAKIKERHSGRIYSGRPKARYFQAPPSEHSERRGSRGGGHLSSPALFHRQAGERLEDTVDLLDLVDDQGAYRVHVGRFADRNHVVLPSDCVGGGDAARSLHLLRDLERASW